MTWLYFDENDNCVAYSNAQLNDDRFLEVELDENDYPMSESAYYYTINRETMEITKGEPFPLSPMPEE